MEFSADQNFYLVAANITKRKSLAIKGENELMRDMSSVHLKCINEHKKAQRNNKIVLPLVSLPYKSVQSCFKVCGIIFLISGSDLTAYFV